MRLPDWQKRFAEFGQARASMPFSWGSNDCCLFAAHAVEAVTGRNPMAEFEAYGTAAGPRRKALRRLLRAIDKAGGLRAFVTAHLGEPVSPRMAGVGDVVMVANEGDELVGVCNGVNVVAPGKDGMVCLSMSDAIAAWKI
jgi:hypothetical protein